MEGDQMSQEEAYDQARKEFYAYRHREDLQRRVAREEALNTGANFGPNQIDIGIELEGAAYDDWKRWALEESTMKRQEAAAMYTDIDSEQSSASSEADEIKPQAEEYEKDEEVSGTSEPQAEIGKMSEM